MRYRITFMMRSFLFILAAVFLLPSCERKELLNETGVYRSPNGNWRVELLNEAPGLKVTELKRRPFDSKGSKPKGRKKGETFSPSGWVSSPGAFVYFDDDNHVWAFDGRERTVIVGKEDGKLVTWSLESYPGSVPPVFSQMKAGALAP